MTAMIAVTRRSGIERSTDMAFASGPASADVSKAADGPSAAYEQTPCGATNRERVPAPIAARTPWLERPHQAPMRRRA
jgi:hypothetical protein